MLQVPGREVAVVGVACGSEHTLFLSAGGEAYACGASVFGQLGLGGPPGGSGFRLREGDVGSGHGGAGDPQYVRYVAEAVALRIPDSHFPVVVPPLPFGKVAAKVVAVAAGGNSSVLVVRDPRNAKARALYVCGKGEQGQFGGALPRGTNYQSAPSLVTEFEVILGKPGSTTPHGGGSYLAYK
jgi:alpha-tubulin suppressor-like RCC1 family protein